MKTSQKVIVIVGPTASGKSDFAVKLAQKYNGEIISADSRQVYKDLDIGTGKITSEEMKGVPHHMLSVYDLDEDISVARFARDATPILKDILSRGNTPIICGGTGQYIDALIYDTRLPQVPPNKLLRKDLEKKTCEELFSLLLARDPARAKIIDRHNPARLVRALEIADTLGAVPACSEPKLIYPTDIYILSPTRELLRTRITKRLEKRLLAGMIDEVREIMNRGYTSNSMKRFGLEYVAIGKYIEGILTMDEMKSELITKSMQYAKRQETWNKKYIPSATIVTTEV